MTQSMTVLAIDDEQSVLDEICRTLSDAGHQCLCANCAGAADQILGQVTPDLILIDINLAGHSGLSLGEHLKQQSGLAEVPVMFLSATQGPDIIRRCQAGSGNCYHLRKPFDAPLLLQLIEQVVPAPHMVRA